VTALSVLEREATLLDLLDRLLDKGVVAAGELTLSVAGVDLIFASLRLVVTSVDKIGETQAHCYRDGGHAVAPGPIGGYTWAEPAPRCHGDGTECEAGNSFAAMGDQHGSGSKLPASPPLMKGEGSTGGRGKESDDCNGLAKLVLILVELLRKLLEREALRRTERGTLEPWEMERLGQAFLRMERRMREMREFFHLEEEDLNLDLGPLGKLR